LPAPSPADKAPPATCAKTCKDCIKFRWYIRTVPKSTPTSTARQLRRSICKRCRDCKPASA
jgi:hypothetical protein